MKEYIFTAEVTVSASTRVNANSEDEAREIVEGRNVKIGGWGSGISDKNVWVVEEADGEAQNITLSE